MPSSSLGAAAGAGAAAGGARIAARPLTTPSMIATWAAEGLRGLRGVAGFLGAAFFFFSDEVAFAAFFTFSRGAFFSFFSAGLRSFFSVTFFFLKMGFSEATVSEAALALSEAEEDDMATIRQAWEGLSV